jgi:hypothetical protein
MQKMRNVRMRRRRPDAAPARRRRTSALTLMAVSGLLLAGCATGESAGEASDGGSAEDEHSHAATSDRTEVGALTPRIVLAHDGGVTTLDSSDGSVLDETRTEGYTRLNPAGDGRHVMVSAAGAVTPYDTGLIAQAHGDHFHYYTQDPALLDAPIEADEPGHVVAEGDRTTVFADGTGTATIFDSTHLADGDLGTTTTLESEHPHHGVAVPLEDGSVLHTQGTEDERHTVQVTGADGKTLAQTDDCPGVHGEAVTKGGAVSVGCENGPVVYRDGDFHKVKIADDYGLSGSQKGSEKSPIALGSYKTQKNPKDGIERPTKIALIDTRDDTLRTVDLGAAYGGRSLDRGPDGEALVLTTDGKLKILDPESGKVTKEVKVTEPWTEDENWQAPSPMLDVADGTAFVVDPEAKKLTMVDLDSGKAYNDIDLDVVPHEMQVTTGTASGEYDVTP